MTDTPTGGGTTTPPEGPGPGGRIEPIELQTSMQRAYIDYAMAVIVGRALPDVRDGLKPVHRRVLYAMFDGGYRPDRGFSKCSRVVGDVMGQYHPHGDTAIYDTLVRLAQPWVMRAPLVHGQGNFGSPGQRLRGRDALHRVSDGSAGAGDGPRHRPGHRRLPAELRRPLAGAGGPAGPLPQPPGQRLRRDRGGHGHQHPAPQPARGRRRRPVGARAPRGHPRGAPGRPGRADQGPRLPQRRADRGARGHRAGLPDRPRVGHAARGHRDRRGRQGPHLPVDHRAALHGQPRQPRPQDRRARRLRQGAGHLRRARRLVGAHRPAPGRRTPSRRGRTRGAQQPAQAHRAPDQLQRQHAGPGRRGPAHADGRPVHQQLGHPPDRGHPATHPLSAGRRRAPRPRPAWPGQGARHARRGHRADPAHHPTSTTLARA